MSSPARQSYLCSTIVKVFLTASKKWNFKKDKQSNINHATSSKVFFKYLIFKCLSQSAKSSEQKHFLVSYKEKTNFFFFFLKMEVMEQSFFLCLLCQRNWRRKDIITSVKMFSSILRSSSKKSSIYCSKLN